MISTTLSHCADEELGIAWIISQKSPGLSDGQVRWFARVENKRDTFGLCGRKGAKTKHRVRESLNTDVASSTNHVESIERAELAHVIANELGDLGMALLCENGDIRSAAAKCGIAMRTAYRRVAEIRGKFADSIC